MRNRALALLAWLSLTGAPVLACQCEMFNACNEVAATNLVFIGTVESIEPAFFSRWNPSSRENMKALNDAFLEAQQHASTTALARLKDAYFIAFPDAPAERKKQVQAARTAAAVASQFYSGMGRGMTVHLRVQKLFKHSGDDDDDKPDERDNATDDAKVDDKKADDPQAFEVWTPFGDCGISFQTGETYLVYASDDEESNNPISTDSCSRTRRLSDAGDDLAYLYFYKNRPKAATRLEGYLTSDRRYLLDFDPLHPERIKAPVAGPVVELQSDRIARFLEADRDGHFLFDGLPAGDYKLSAYASGYPAESRQLAGPQPFHLAARSCALQVVVIPPEEFKPK